MRKQILFFSVIATLVSAHDDISKNGDVVNLYEEGDYRLIEGDILVPKESHLRGAISQYRGYWPYNDRYDKYIVTYLIDDKPIFDAAKKSEIFSTMAFYEKHTNLKFIEKTNQHSTGWVNITDTGKCSSAVGMNPSGQVMSLTSFCKFADILHEWGHAFGLAHEHQRADRGVHVTVNTSGDDSSPDIDYDIKKASFYDSGQITPYDKASIMHYRSYSVNGTTNIEFHDDDEAYNLYWMRSIPSTCDMREINILYPGEVKPGPCIPHQPENIYTPTELCLRNKSKEYCDLLCSTSFRKGQHIKFCEHPTLEELRTMEPLPQYAYTGDRALPLYT